jgi:site-specific DNA-cytosine methylase
MNIIYLASYTANLNTQHTVYYQDKYIKRDIGGDMLEIDLNPYDLIIATPPCNYYSRGNYRRNTSLYSLETKHLLPDILYKLSKQVKPYIVENVRNPKLMETFLKNYNGFIYYYGRHTYFSNVLFAPHTVKQIKENIQNMSKLKREGGYNVNNVIELFIETVNDIYGK